MLVGEEAREAVRVAPRQDENHAIEADVAVEPGDVAGARDFARHRSDDRRRLVRAQREGRRSAQEKREDGASSRGGRDVIGDSSDGKCSKTCRP